jgi:hypothetical protein
MSSLGSTWAQVEINFPVGVLTRADGNISSVRLSNLLLFAHCYGTPFEYQSPRHTGCPITMGKQ